MKLRIYYNIYPWKTEDELKYFSIDTKWKLGKFFDADYDMNWNIILHNGEEDFIWPTIETREFNCKYDNTYLYEFRRNRLNYKITFYHMHENDNWYLPQIDWYTYLNLIQRQKIEYIFWRHWIQKPENIKWLFSIPVSIITTLLTLYFTSLYK